MRARKHKTCEMPHPASVRKEMNCQLAVHSKSSLFEKRGIREGMKLVVLDA